ncbi:uncharacterized protein [Diabrotica undecimpunctata]|uniref:uncharacterized protein n=1 Tax=Diabrotica undecimpunctata TaxID=50387 RepID=UPI003B633DDB
MPTIGIHSLHEESNNNGTRLIHFASSMNMVIASTCFRHNKGTWRSPDGNTVNQIDLAVVDARHFSDVIDVRARRGANIDTNHYLLQAKLRARISYAKKEKEVKEERFKVEALNNPEIDKRFEESLESKLKSCTDVIVEDINNYWRQCRAILKEVPTEVIGKQKRKKLRSDWYDEECAQATQRKIRHIEDSKGEERDKQKKSKDS